MSSLRSVLTLPRVMRHGSAVGADLPPDEAVVLDARDAPLRTALAEAARGDFDPARKLLAGTRTGAEWERRDTYVSALAQSAVLSPGWLDAWLAEDPEDPDAVLVKADLCVQQAWRVRSGARAAEVPEDQFEAFFALLEDAVPVVALAAELSPTDPVPWRIALTHARGIQAPRDVFDDYWAQAVARAPHHYGCHTAALQYLCEKWYGSHDEMFAFAEEAAEAALPGSKLNALPLLAAFEYQVVSDNAEADADERQHTTRRIKAAVDLAIELSAWHEPGDPDAADFRNHLAMMLILAQRWDDSLDQFRAIGVHATRFPWAFFGEPRKEFLEFRTGVRMQVASRTPLFARPAATAPVTAAATVPGHSPHFLAIAAAPLEEVAEAALMCGSALRMARAPGSRTFVELVGERGTLTRAVHIITTGEKWPALVVHRTADRSGFTLSQRGRQLTAHTWNPAAPIPDLNEVTPVARTLAKAFGLPDLRPLTTLLRGSDSAASRLAALLKTLGLPPLPEDFGLSHEALAPLPDARIVARAAHGPRPTRWWLLRLLGLLLFLPATVYAWWAPDVGSFRSVLCTIALLYVSGQLWRARRQRLARRQPAQGMTQGT